MIFFFFFKGLSLPVRESLRCFEKEKMKYTLQQITIKDAPCVFLNIPPPDKPETLSELESKIQAKEQLHMERLCAGSGLETFIEGTRRDNQTESAAISRVQFSGFAEYSHLKYFTVSVRRYESRLVDYFLFIFF